jgi:hypothetical protein
MEHSQTPYRIDYAGQYRRQLEDLINQAVRLGTLADLEAAVKMIHQRLSTAPSEWGDPLYRLRYLELDLYRGTHTPLNIIYAVDEQRKLVYLTQVWPMPGHGYTQET